MCPARVLASGWSGQRSVRELVAFLIRLLRHKGVVASAARSKAAVRLPTNDSISLSSSSIRELSTRSLSRGPHFSVR